MERPLRSAIFRPQGFSFAFFSLCFRAQVFEGNLLFCFVLSAALSRPPAAGGYVDFMRRGAML